MPGLTDRDGGMDWKERERVLWRKRFDFSQFSLFSVMLAVLSYLTETAVYSGEDDGRCWRLIEWVKLQRGLWDGLNRCVLVYFSEGVWCGVSNGPRPAETRQYKFRTLAARTGARARLWNQQRRSGHLQTCVSLLSIPSQLTQPSLWVINHFFFLFLLH